MGRAAVLLSLAAAVAAAPGSGQSPLGAGVTAGAVKLTDQRSEQALTGIVDYQATPWLLFTVSPAFLHVSDQVSGSPVSSNGPGDLPLSAAASHAFASPGSPVVAAALTLVLPLGDATCGLGSGTTAVGVDVGAGASPSSRLHLSGDASRSVTGLSAQSTLSAPHATSLRAEAGYDVSPRWRTSVSLGADVGQADSTQGLSRVLGAGASHALGGRMAVTLDGSVGLTAASPKWALSLGLGTVFAGTSPVSLSAPLRRLGSAFVGGVSRGGGAGKVGCK
jgi:outer membrane putative beta-barrel porin/alpha-amylase